MASYRGDVLPTAVPASGGRSGKRVLGWRCHRPRHLFLALVAGAILLACVAVVRMAVSLSELGPAFNSSAHDQAFLTWQSHRAINVGPAKRDGDSVTRTGLVTPRPDTCAMTVWPTAACPPLSTHVFHLPSSFLLVDEVPSAPSVAGAGPAATPSVAHGYANVRKDWGDTHDTHEHGGEHGHKRSQRLGAPGVTGEPTHAGGSRHSGSDAVGGGDIEASVQPGDVVPADRGAAIARNATCGSLCLAELLHVHAEFVRFSAYCCNSDGGGDDSTALPPALPLVLVAFEVTAEWVNPAHHSDGAAARMEDVRFVVQEPPGLLVTSIPDVSGQDLLVSRRGVPAAARPASPYAVLTGFHPTPLHSLPSGHLSRRSKPWRSGSRSGRPHNPLPQRPLWHRARLTIAMKSVMKSALRTAGKHMAQVTVAATVARTMGASRRHTHRHRGRTRMRCPLQRRCVHTRQRRTLRPTVLWRPCLRVMTTTLSRLPTPRNWR